MTTDRTFSHLDVIRIFNEHLTVAEQDIVLKFFGGKEGGIFSEFEVEALKRTAINVNDPFLGFLPGSIAALEVFLSYIEVVDVSVLVSIRNETQQAIRTIFELRESLKDFGVPELLLIPLENILDQLSIIVQFLEFAQLLDFAPRAPREYDRRPSSSARRRRSLGRQGDQLMPKQRPIEQRIESLEKQLLLLKQVKRVETEQSKLNNMRKPRRRRTPA